MSVADLSSHVLLSSSSDFSSQVTSDTCTKYVRVSEREKERCRVHNHTCREREREREKRKKTVLALVLV